MSYFFKTTSIVPEKEKDQRAYDDPQRIYEKIEYDRSIDQWEVIMRRLDLEENDDGDEYTSASFISTGKRRKTRCLGVISLL